MGNINLFRSGTSLSISLFASLLAGALAWLTPATGRAEQFDLFERWMSSDVAMAGRIFREMSDDIFKRNQLARGEFEVGGRKVEVEQIRCSLLNVVADYDDVVHPRSSLGLVTPRGTKTLRARLDAEPNTLYSAVGQLAPGEYALRWKARARDGQMLMGTIPFRVAP